MTSKKSQRTGKKRHVRIVLPKGYERVKIVPDTSRSVSTDNYEKLIEEDYEAHRATYVEVEIYGVPVKVKVAPKDS